MEDCFLFYQNMVTVISKLIKYIGEGINFNVTDGIKALLIIFQGYIQLTADQGSNQAHL